MRLVRLETLPRNPLTEAEGALSMLAVCSEAGEALAREGELVADEGADGRSGGICNLGFPEEVMSWELLFLCCMAACTFLCNKSFFPDVGKTSNKHCPRRYMLIILQKDMLL